MPSFDRTNLTKVIVGGKPVGFTKSTGSLHLAGDDLTLKEWQELEKRVNLFFHRAGLLEKKKGQGDPSSGTSSFLTANLKQVLARDIGIIKDPPLWLKWLYSGVISKDNLREL